MKFLLTEKNTEVLIRQQDVEDVFNPSCVVRRGLREPALPLVWVYYDIAFINTVTAVIQFVRGCGYDQITTRPLFFFFFVIKEARRIGFESRSAFLLAGVDSRRQLFERGADELHPVSKSNP